MFSQCCCCTQKQKHQILAADDLTMIKYLYGSAWVTNQNAWWCISNYETCKVWWKWSQCEQERMLSKCWTVYLLMSISRLSWWRLYCSCSETLVQGTMSTHVLKLVPFYPSAWQCTDLQLKSCRRSTAWLLSESPRFLLPINRSHILELPTKPESRGHHIIFSFAS